METEAESDREAELDRVKELSMKLCEVLSGNPRHIQAMVLTDAVALWIASHFGPEEDLEEFRKETVEMFIRQIWRLIPINADLLKSAMSADDKKEFASMMELVQAAKAGARKH